MEDHARRDFFISYTAADRAWAEWIARVLDEAGYSNILQSRDFRPGNDFLYEMHAAAEGTRRTLAVLSQRYLDDSPFGGLEWRSALNDDPDGRLRRLIPVRVDRCRPSGLLGSRVHIDLAGLDEGAAGAALLRGIADEVPSPSGAFPGATSGGSGGPPPFPGGGDPPAGDGARAGREAVPWDRLRETRPSVARLLGQDRPLIGHAEVRRLLRDRADGVGPVSLVLLAGPAGSGKSSLLRWLERTAGVRVVHVNAVLEQLRRQLRGAALEVEHLVDRLQSAVPAGAQEVVLAYDDADHDLLQQAVIEFIRTALEELDPGLLVVTTTTPLANELFPVPARSRSLDRRTAGFDEFDELVDRLLDAARVARAAFTPALRESLHDLSEQTPDFRTVESVLEMLMAYVRSTGGTATLEVLRSLVTFEQQRSSLQLPEVASGPRLTFRRKDKSELLAGLFRRHFSEPSAFAELAAGRLAGFDPDDFLAEARRSDRSYRHALTSLCLTHSPGDLVLSLLSPEQVRTEVEALHLDPAQLIGQTAEQAHLLVRGLGFTLVDAPVGLKDFQTAVKEAQALVVDRDKSTERLIEATRAVVEHTETALRDLLHFWATYLFDSVGDLVKRRNAGTPERSALQVRSLRTADVVELLHLLDAQAQDEDFRFRLSSLEVSSPLSAALLTACDEFARQRSRFLDALPDVSRDGAAADLREQCERLVRSAGELLDRAGDGSFPTVIKLSEIVFDEYSRRIFRGVDSEGNDVRFAITDRQDLDDLVVAAHYYLLPFKRVSVNPRIVPRAGRRPHVLFDNGRRYAAASWTQRQQGRTLLSVVELAADQRVIEVGCGTGALAVQVAPRVAHLHCIDVSPGMLGVAEDLAAESGLRNITFEVADLLEYDADQPYDVLLSNSTMHWITPPERAYGRLYRLLKPGGRLAVHQGGHDNYRGLRACAARVVRRLHRDDLFVGWKYPLYYPTPVELRDLLVSLGFEDVHVDSQETDGSESPSLVHDFSVAGLLPFLHVLPETEREVFRTAFLEEAESRPPDRYTHRLYVVARRP